ncbi:hypothetical protein C5167_047343 [Papaver somniferum]|uniref:Uncharacterized protein n=1 Tax=Papaver somniferum TaxID=3469 RepID=A0A4Y7LIW7_PAPSO|nr:hypothetical protein C5167_047343 [Papaver somniferum]
MAASSAPKVRNVRKSCALAQTANFGFAPTCNYVSVQFMLMFDWKDELYILGSGSPMEALLPRPANKFVVLFPTCYKKKLLWFLDLLVNRGGITGIDDNDFDFLY